MSLQVLGFFCPHRRLAKIGKVQARGRSSNNLRERAIVDCLEQAWPEVTLVPKLQWCQVQALGLQPFPERAHGVGG